MSGWWIVALVSLAAQLVFGLLIAVIAVAVQRWRVWGWARRIATGKMKRQDAYARYVAHSKTVNALLISQIAFVPGLALGAGIAYSSLASEGRFTLPLPAPPTGSVICSFGLAVLLPLAAYALLFGRFVAPQVKRDLRGQTQAQATPFAAQLRGLAVRNARPFLFVEALGLFYLLGWQDERWLLIPISVVVMALWLAGSSLIIRWLQRLVPLEQTEWVDLAPRITAWCDLAQVRLDHVYVGYALGRLSELGTGQVFVYGIGRRQLVLGAAFLRNTDWRQRDAVIAHELGHLRQHDSLINGLIAIIKATALVAAFTLLDLPAFIALVNPFTANRVPYLLALMPFSVLLTLEYGIEIIERQRRPRVELQCDRYSVYLTGDPLAHVIALHTLSNLLGTPLDYRGSTHPILKNRMQRIAAFGQQQQPHLAPWANNPVPANVQLKRSDGSVVGTAPLASAPPAAPVPPRPWAEMPPAAVPVMSAAVQETPDATTTAST